MNVNHVSNVTLQIWVLKCGVLKYLVILCEHCTKAIIGGAKMANNRYANMHFIQSY